MTTPAFVARVDDTTEGAVAGSAGVTVGPVGLAAVCALTFGVLVALHDGTGLHVATGDLGDGDTIEFISTKICHGRVTSTGPSSSTMVRNSEFVKVRTIGPISEAWTRTDPTAVSLDGISDSVVCMVRM